MEVIPFCVGGVRLCCILGPWAWSTQVNHTGGGLCNAVDSVLLISCS